MNINSRIKQLLQISLVAIVLMSSGISVMAQTFDADNIAFGGINGSPDKPGGLSIQLCKSEKKEFYIRYSS